MCSFLCALVLVFIALAHGEAPYILQTTVELQGDTSCRLPITLLYFSGAFLVALFRTGLRWGPDELDTCEKVAGESLKPDKLNTHVVCHT